MTVFFEQDSHLLAVKLGDHLQKRAWRCAVAESCTGGGLAALITDCAGSSQWFECGFVTYSNQAKSVLLGVSPQTLAVYGAVSEPTAREMAEGARRISQVEITTSITGIAGPTGGTPSKPVGTVWIAWSVMQQATTAKCFQFEGDRLAVRRQAIQAALQGLVGGCE